MKNPKYALVLILLLWPAASRAQDCKVRFSVAYSDGTDLQVGLTADQTKLWQHDAEKRYKGLCLDTEKPDYLIYWTQNVAGDALVQSAVRDINRSKVVAPSTSQRFGPENSTLRIIANPGVREMAYYYVLDLSKQPPEVVRKGTGSQDRPAEANRSTRSSGGTSTVRGSQEVSAGPLEDDRRPGGCDEGCLRLAQEKIGMRLSVGSRRGMLAERPCCQHPSDLQCLGKRLYR